MNHRASPTTASIRQANIWRGFLLALVLLAAGCTLPTSGGEESIQVSGAPVVSIASPQANATFLEGVQVFVQAAVSNAGSDISRVEVAIDNTIVETLENPNPDGAAVFSITHTWEAAEAGSHTIAVTAFRSSSNESGTQNVTINVIDQASRATPTPTPTPEEEAEEPSDDGGSNNTGDNNSSNEEEDEPTNAPEPTNPPEPTEPPATEMPSVPIAVVVQTGTAGGINVRGGPGTVYPVVGTLAVNATAEIVGRNIDQNQPWYKIRFNNVSQAWILASLVEVQGDVSGLPTEAGPPPPPTAIPPTLTPIPATVIPATVPASVNLAVVDPFLNPPVPVCRQELVVGMTIRNDGATATTTGLSRIQVVRVSTGEVFRTSGDALVAVTLNPGQTHRVEFRFTIDVYTNERHRVEFIADANSQVVESNETDNRIGVEYPFGAC